MAPIRPPKRPFSSNLECCICYNNYDLDTLFPVIGTCGHTICASCRDRLPKKCPVCQEPDSFEHEVKNFSLLGVLEELLKEEGPLPKRMKGKCFHCQNPAFTSVVVCVECLKKKDYDSFDAVMKELSATKMCYQCAQIVISHCGHKMSNFNTIQGLFISKNLRWKMECEGMKMTQNFVDLRTAVEVATQSHLKLKQVLIANPRFLLSPEVNPEMIQEHMFKEVQSIHKMMKKMIGSIWECTQKCMEAEKSITGLKQRYKARNFTSSEIFTFSDILDPLMDPQFPAAQERINSENWNWMDQDLKEAKVAEMIQRFLSSGSDSIPQDDTNGEDEEET